MKGAQYTDNELKMWELYGVSRAYVREINRLKEAVGGEESDICSGLDLLAVRDLTTCQDFVIPEVMSETFRDEHSEIARDNGGLFEGLPGGRWGILLC